MTQEKKPNRLIHEKSPYLLQHARNPVDWFPWGEEAFRKAHQENKPIFLSIGYSTCYWCHVMEREVFEDEDIARLMNETLVCIKVDREERPDVDRIYMAAVQAINGNGGWPMSLFLTPDRKPFFGATYIPPETRYGRPGFPEIVNKISELWSTDRQKLLDTGDQLTQFLRSVPSDPGAGFQIDHSLTDRAFQRFQQAFDLHFGGFGNGTKFPRPSAFNFLLRYYYRTKNPTALEMVLTTLRAMAAGGINDHLGGGFHRYSVDEQWRVPHFEKMLYDQAQLAVSYLEAYQITHEEEYAETARSILAYVLRDLTDPAGGFYSAEDAESAPDPALPDVKEEGAFYLWDSAEIDRLLDPPDAEIFKYRFGVELNGNALRDPMQVFSGKNILFVSHSLEEVIGRFGKSSAEVDAILNSARRKLFDARNKRPRPQLDDKVITAWNGLMISACARAFQILGDDQFLQAGKDAANFILQHLYDASSHRLLRRFREGDARFDAGLQDYAFLVSALLDLYESSFELHWFEQAVALTRSQIGLFEDSVSGGFFDSPASEETLLFRSRDDYDGAEPTGNSVTVLNLLRISEMTGETEWRSRAERAISVYAARLQSVPDVLAQMLCGIEWLLSSPKEIILVGKNPDTDMKGLLHIVHEQFMPHRALLHFHPGTGVTPVRIADFVSGLKMMDGKAAAYVCVDYTCNLPTNNPETLKKLLRDQPS